MKGCLNLKKDARAFYALFAIGLILVICIYFLGKGSDAEDSPSSVRASEIRRPDSELGAAPALRSSEIPKIGYFELSKTGRSLQVIDRDTLSVSSSAVSLIGLSEKEVADINRALAAFTSKLFQAEVSRAHIEVSDFGEEVVVPSFDRRPFVAEFRREIGGFLSADITKFLVERVEHDIEFGSVTTELRVSLSDGVGGREMVNFTRDVLSSKSYDPDVPRTVKMGNTSVPIRFAATYRMRSSAFLSDNRVLPRISMIFSSVDKLPKKKKNAE